MRTGSSRPQPSAIALPANQLRRRLRAGFLLVTSLKKSEFLSMVPCVCGALSGRFPAAQPDVWKDEDQRPAGICPLILSLLFFVLSSPLFPVQSHHGLRHAADAPTVEKLHISTETTDPATSGVTVAPLPLLHPSGRPPLPPPTRAPRM